MTHGKPTGLRTAAPASPVRVYNLAGKLLRVEKSGALQGKRIALSIKRESKACNAQ